jgi:uncharacterized protein YceK
MNKFWLILAAVIVLSGCTRSGIIEHNINLGRHTVTPATSPDYDYDVKVTQEVDIGWNTANPEDRMRVVRQLLGDSCQSPVIVSEKYVDRGEYTIGTKKGVYFIKVSCPK